ncbi:alginate lyase family protein [Spirilliplanes yamanashiensis]|uniref:alginate lyase family protein n=1 Tax=Spirilliplanes yamanashiensis TaxID=42233 RepID=UPI0019503C42|nr:alginate lyase family protein [Spirilliplanes yamanashiensis]MDP9814786.1 hypothetical protein [Spirilliplanes yamanashiensis]
MKDLRVRMRTVTVAAVAATAVVTALAGGVARPRQAHADAPFPFTLESAASQPATGTPVPPSGRHAALVRNTSVATTTVEGSGRVVIGATGSHCEGWPKLRVTVDGTVLGTVSVEHPTQYGAHTVGPAVGPGRHTVRIAFVNDHMTKTCDRNAFVASAQLEYPPSAEFGSAVFLTNSRIAALKERVAAGTQPTRAGWNALLAAADKDLDREPTVPGTWLVPWYYDDPAGHNAMLGMLRGQANAAYRLALVHRITGDERYAAAAARQITTWIDGVRTYSTAEDSTLAFSNSFPLMTFAAHLLRSSPSFPAATQEAFAQFLRTRALGMSTMSHQNNWGNWGLVLEVSTAAYLGDRMLFDRAATRWKQFVEQQIAADGHLPLEVHRADGLSGILYSNFALHPQTLAAEIMRANGLDLYDYRAPNGRTLRLAFDRIAGWVHDPATYPYRKDPAATPNYMYNVGYWEVLHMRWPNPAAGAVLASRRPVKDDPMSIGMTFTHGGLL